MSSISVKMPDYRYIIIIIVHGFWPKFEKFDFGNKQCQAIEHLKGSRMAQISAS